jgi:hypothetical protein
VLKYLREVDRYGSAADEQQQAELTALLGDVHFGTADGNRSLIEAVVAGTIPEDLLLRYFSRQVTRETALLRPAMGVLADRRFDPLE